MQRLILGCGYLGQRVAQRWGDAGDEVVVVTRSRDRAAEFKERGWRPIVDDVRSLSRELLSDERSGTFDSVATVLVSVGYDRSQGAAIGEVYQSAVQAGIALAPHHLRRFIYISTTGVYGDAGGGWVDEQTTPDPQRDGGKASLRAEQELRASLLGGRGVALRLAGIYGPGRVPFLDNLTAGEPIPAPAAGRVNLIHVEDAADVVVAASNHQGPLPPVLCVSDGNPPIRGDYYREAARLIGAPEPTFVDPPTDSPRATRAASDKQVRNSLMKQTLPVSLRYPDYKAGLAAILGKGDVGG